MRKLVRIGLLSALLSITSTACYFEFIKPVKVTKEKIIHRNLSLNLPRRVKLENGSSILLEAGNDKLGKYLSLTAYDSERLPVVAYTSRNFDKREDVRISVKDPVSRRDNFGTVNVEMIERKSNERDRLNYMTILDSAFYNIIR